MYYTKRHFSDDSPSTDSSYLSDSDETIAEEESKINKVNSSKDEEKQLEFPLNAASQEDHTPTESIEERPNLDSDPDNRIVPASSILVLEDPLSVFPLCFCLFRLKFGVFERRKIV